jgi:hypothetical protein
MVNEGMKRELTDALCRDFPRLYKTLDNPRQSLMCFGFEHGDGWNKILRELSERLMVEVSKMPPEDQEAFEILQVKEKFGTLRIATTFGTEEIWRLIDEAQKKSAKTCEVCGLPGKIRRGGWISTLCLWHALPHWWRYRRYFWYRFWRFDR